MTYTYALIDVSEATFNEIKKKLEEAYCWHAIHKDKALGTLLDMHGLALRMERKDENKDPKRNSKTSE